MIHYVLGDAVRDFHIRVIPHIGDIDILVHGCNCYHTMGAGIAKQISGCFPEALIEDKKTPIGPEKLGTISIAKVKRLCGVDGYIINAYTQDTYWDTQRMLSYEAVKNCMIQVREFAQAKNLSIAMPKIGCGLAGGDWEKVSGILEEVFEDKIKYFVYFK